MRSKTEYGTVRERSSPEKKPATKSYSIEEAIEAIGFGRFHLRISMVTCLANIADSMEINILGILGPVLQCEWSLSDWQIALYSSMIFVSNVIFSPFVGELSDRYGRRRILLLVLLIGAYFGLLSGFAPTYTWLLVLRFFVGCMMTSSCLTIVYLAEFMPKKHRGKTLTLANMTCFSMGSLLEVLLAYAILGRLGFRTWIAASAIPLALAAVFTYMSPNTPRFDLVAGNTAEAQGTLEQMVRVNQGTLPEGTLVSNIPVSNTMPFKKRIALLFSQEYRRTTVLLLIYGFTIMFAFYGTLISSVELLSRTGSKYILGEDLDTEIGVCALNCEDSVTSSLGSLALIAFAEFIGSIVGSFLVDKTGRKFLMIYPTIMLEIFEIFLIFIMDNRPLLISLLFLIRFVTLTPSGMPYTYCAEVYPTSFRTTGEAMTFVSERIGAALSPFVAQILLRTNPTLALCVFASVAFIAATVAIFLPVETANVGLKDT